MYISVFDLFKIGIGPSSSHTVGPMIASNKFIKHNNLLIKDIYKINIELFGSLAFTGKGHGTDKAIILGLYGFNPQTIDVNDIKECMSFVSKNKKIKLNGNKIISFNPNVDVVFNYKDSSHKYSNTLRFKAFDKKNEIISEKIYYSIGGGFILDDGDGKVLQEKKNLIPYLFDTAQELLMKCNKFNFRICDLILANEKSVNPNEDIYGNILKIWQVMNNSIYKGMTNTGVLNGRIKLKRRANSLYKKLLKKSEKYDPLYVMDWVNVFAIAVSEENASFGRIVTAPTNGASGIIPSVIKYYKEFVKDSSNDGIINFILTASAIGSLYKKNASISGSEAGCQGEVGVACSMAAAGLTAALNGSNEQIENAAEIAMEHNLGLTCDPVNGLVQIPCIERNAMGSVKAINACRLAMNGSGLHHVSLDQVIQTMWDTGKDMKSIYKETSKGGLAVNVVEC